MTKSKFPNTSILSLITQKLDNEEKLLFIYLKPVPDFYSLSSVHWYEGAGKEGKSSIIWPVLSIRQWVGCGSDLQIKELIGKILSLKKLEINQVVIDLTIPQYSIESDNNSRKRSRNDLRADFLKMSDLSFIPQEFYQKENLELLTGYKKRTDTIKPMFPIGFFEDGFIHKNLRENVFGVIEIRTPYLTFHGVRSSSEKGVGTNVVVGFYQKILDKRNYTAVVKNESGEELGRGVINESGFFKTELSQPNKSGSVAVLVDDDVEDTIDYHFIQDIQITGHIADTTYSDSYGRSFMITSDMRKRPASIPSITWQRNVFAASSEANSKLADLFKQVFDYLGPKIVVADPYFIGNFKMDEVTKVTTITNCQQAFIAALIHSAVEKGISQITILGCSRVTNQLDNDSDGQLEKIEVMLERYEKLFKRLIEENRLKKVLVPSSIIVKRATSDFHNRYWFSLKESDGIEVLDKCVVVTNSIGNINEVDLVPITDEAQLRQIVLRYLGLYRNANQLLAI